MITLETKKGTRIEVINLGNFLLDGGTMFGRIPKVMWEKWFPSDRRNRILMATNVIRIFHNDGKVYQVDAGLGSLYTDKERDILGIGESKPERKSVDDLILTHLHFDHCGGISDLHVRRKVVVSKKEWEDAHEVTVLTKGSYRQKDLELMEKKLILVEPHVEISPGIEIIPTPGHTRGHTSVLVDNEVFFAGDLIPTYAHVHLPCIMAYDLYPLEVLKVKQDILKRARAKGWKVIFEHDPYEPVKEAGDLDIEKLKKHRLSAVQGYQYN